MLFQITSKIEMPFKISVKWQFSGFFFDFMVRVILTSEGYLLKMTPKKILRVGWHV